MKKKALSILLTTAMASAMLAGCGSGSTTTTESSDAAESTATEAAAETTSEAAAEGAADYESCTITLDWWGGDPRHEATNAAVAAFMEAYPGITVEVNYGAWSDWETAKAAEYIAGNNPDVQQVNLDWIGKYDANGETYLDLNEVADTLDLTQWDDSILSYCKDSKGGLAGVPVSMTGRTFYYNNKTWEAAGLEVPTSLAELEAAGPVFQEVLGDKYYPMVLNEYDRMIVATFYLQAQYGEPIISQEGNLNYTEEQLKEGLAFIERLEDEHVIPTEEYILGEGDDTFDKSGRFINGEYGGYFEWNSSIGKYAAAIADNGGTLAISNLFDDMGPLGTGSYNKVSQMFSISAKTEHPHECALLIQYLLNEEEGVKLMGTERGIPASKAALAILQEEGDIDELDQEAYDKATATDGTFPLYWNPLFDDASLKGTTGAYKDVYDALSFGTYDLDTAAHVLYEAFTAVAPAAN